MHHTVDPSPTQYPLEGYFRRWTMPTALLCVTFSLSHSLTCPPYTKSVYIMAHYAKDYKAQRAPESTTVGEPLPQSPRSRPSQPLPDPLAHQLGQKHNRGYGGNRILQGMDPNARKALQPGRS